MSKNISFISQHRNFTSFDLRAELLFDSLLSNNIDDLNITVNHKGLFYRRYSKDKTDLYQDILNPETVFIETSRDGFYDILPENIVHNYRNRDQKEDIVQEFKTRKKEEKEARHFFNPIENELFRFRHAVEKYESDFFSNISNNGIADIIKHILAIDETISDVLVVKTYYALLKQNQEKEQGIDKIVTILENILQEKVTYSITNIELDNTHDIVNEREELVLGVNTTLQSNQKIFLKKYNFNIGPLVNSENLEFYFENQKMKTFVNTFFNLFLPFHIQYQFDILLNPQDEQFYLDNTNYKSRLGISTVL